MKVKKLRETKKLLLTITLVNILSVISLAQNLYNNPESIVYDSIFNRYLVSNVGTGNIVQVNSDGSTSYFSTVLTRTLGMVIIGDTLYVADITGVVGFDLSTSQRIRTIPISGMDVLNDITNDGTEYLYVTDSGNGNIYKVKISDGTSQIIVSNIYWPNGILYDEFSNRLLFCAFGSNVPIREINLTNYSVSVVITTSLTDLDGLTIDNEHNIYISSWGSNAVYKYDNSFSSPPEIFSSGLNGPADIFFDRPNNVLAVPNFNSNYVEFVSAPMLSLKEDIYRVNYILLQNYPNPFNPKTTIKYQIPKPAFVRLKIFDVLGNETLTLVNAEKFAGKYEINFNGANLPSGIYFYRLFADGLSITKKMLLLK